MTHFDREADALVRMHLYGAAALVLQEKGYTFEEAYRLIFKREPRL